MLPSIVIKNHFFGKKRDSNLSHKHFNYKICLKIHWNLNNAAKKTIRIVRVDDATFHDN